jgi:hypothetical protein
VGSGPNDIVIDSMLNRDSVVQFIAACAGDDFDLTLSNVLERSNFFATSDQLLGSWSERQSRNSLNARAFGFADSFSGFNEV